MVLSLAVVVVILMISFTAYVIKSRKEIAKLVSENDYHEALLKKADETDKNLRHTLKTLETKLSHAIQDPITHLLGRELFEDRLMQSVNESARYALPLALLFIDIDEFKKINSALGYEVGDQFLLEVAKRLQTCIRKVDSLTRLHKDTFICLLTQLAKPETAAIVAKRMLQVLAESFQIGGQEIYVSANIGISIYPADGQDAQSLLRRGEYALRLAKEKGSHTYQFYQESAQVSGQRELTLVSGLSNESALREFVLYYEPIINTKDESIFCMDAKVEWQHAGLGLINAQELFNYAEKKRKLNVITEWSLKEACSQFLKWRTLGFLPKYLGITLSIRQLETSQFIYRFSQILQSLAFKPEWLLLEIKVLEGQLSFDVLEKAFNMLKYLGIKIIIDNFGTSPFLLSYLKKVTVNYLKMDQSMIDDVDVNQQTLALVKSFAFLASNTSMQLISQGVESTAQIKILKELGCDLMQGRIFSPPLSGSEAVDYGLSGKVMV